MKSIMNPLRAFCKILFNQFFRVGRKLTTLANFFYLLKILTFSTSSTPRSVIAKSKFSHCSLYQTILRMKNIGPDAGKTTWLPKDPETLDGWKKIKSPYERVSWKKKYENFFLFFYFSYILITPIPTGNYFLHFYNL